MWTWWQQV
ncbi:maker269 [Drosophila busckii]|uniref:Maker269 n=1 Tax=Drosophila busckii TaxID=30019 RepID=A0A0M5JAA3_DROBS|nr:maker269 [Drosophila busckii]